MISHDISLLTGGGRWKPWRNGAKTQRHHISRLRKTIPDKMVRFATHLPFVNLDMIYLCIYLSLCKTMHSSQKSGNIEECLEVKNKETI